MAFSFTGFLTPVCVTQANLLKVGQVYKVRLELVPQSAGRSPTWKVGHLKMQDLNTRTELLFKFDRWLSRHQDDGEIMRELPVVSKGKEVLPGEKCSRGEIIVSKMYFFLSVPFRRDSYLLLFPLLNCPSCG